ncbi:hypothetical protein ACIRTB_08580 [Streptomyces sp. NPDC101158]|uniref:hypothetical protein n=1 Tax=Streptomyces sp. NPDC101158 TaxID=3366117 RepID=UPI00381D63D9
MLIKHLPTDSAVQRNLHGEAAEWSVTDHLLAAAVDHLATANWMFMCVNTDEDGEQPDPPQPVPRPGGSTEAEEEGEDDDGTAGAGDAEVVSPHQLARFFS